MADAGSNDSDPHPCEVCSFIPADLWANTGRGESMATELEPLVALDLDSRNDLYVCPNCEALFEWGDFSQLSGSGNNDEERLTRLTPEQATIARALLDPDPGERDGELLLEQAFRALSGDIVDNILRYRSRRHNHAFADFVEPLVARLLAGTYFSANGMIASYCGSDRARITEVMRLLDAGGPELNMSAQYLRDNLARELERARRIRPE